MSKNGMPSYGKIGRTVNLTHLPTPKSEYTVTFETMIGGLNTYELPQNLSTRESPNLMNVMWQDGALCSRKGQVWASSETRDKGITCYDGLFYERAFFHSGTRIYAYDPRTDEVVSKVNLLTMQHGGLVDKVDRILTTQRRVYGTDIGTVSVSKITLDGVELEADEDYTVNGYTITLTAAPTVGQEMLIHEQVACKQRGTFFRYGDCLYYKAPGLFVRIAYTNGEFFVSDVVTDAYTPITYINASYSNGSGDSYQPENRLSATKTIWYNAAYSSGTKTFSATGGTTFSFSDVDGFLGVDEVTVNGASTANWYVSGTDLIFYTAPASGMNNVVATYRKTETVYHLPVKSESLTVDKVVVDGVQRTENVDYTVDEENGTVTFLSGHIPPVTYPFTNNTVRITYSLENEDAFNSIMDCPYAIVYGGNTNLCVVLGGCKAQPNAFFWNGNNIAMDIGYWPMEHYNLGGDTEEEITGFGKQQGYLIVLKTKSVGRCTMDFTTVDAGSDEVTARVYIEMDYVAINSEHGCDLPWTIKLVENNLVWCNREQGIHYLSDSSAAYENNVTGISRKVNGTRSRSGILDKLRKTETDKIVCCNDDQRYWLVINGDVYCWDFTLSTASDPSFFYFTGIKAEGFFQTEDRTLYHIDQAGRVTRFEDVFSDYGHAFEKIYEFPPQFFNTYDRLKDITRVEFAVKNTTSSVIDITYKTDWETRQDLTSIRTAAWSIVPRDLKHRNFDVRSVWSSTIRKPGCRHVRNFGVLLENNEMMDMGVVFAQIFYKYQGRDR